MTDVSAEPATVDTAPVDVVDDTPDVVFENVAKEMGWKPIDKWLGDPDKHIDAKAYILNTPKALKAARSQVDTVTKVAEKAIERARMDAINDAKRAVAAAAASGDPDAAVEAAEQLEQAMVKPDPVAAAWKSKNAWFDDNLEAQQLAIAVAGKIGNAGGSTAEQLAAVDKEIRKRFPELFDEPENEAPSRKSPFVEGGQRTAKPAAQKKGWNDLPQTVRQAWPPKMLKSFNFKTPDEFAEAYFKENS